MDFILVFALGLLAGAIGMHFINTKVETAIQRVEAAVKTLKA